MEQQNNNQNYQQNPYMNQNIYGGLQQPIGNATIVLVLGICSIALCTLGPILGTIALILAKNARREYEANPQIYTEASWKNVKTGRICGIIGLCVGIFSWLCMAAYFIWIWYIMRTLTDSMMLPPVH